MQSTRYGPRPDESAMMDWLAAVNSLASDAVLVTVARVEGSGPREPGAKMLVTAQAQFDTIGGGHLEMRAIEIAREMLSLSGTSLVSQHRLERFPLGPSLGQCCGGVVHLAFERIDHHSFGAFQALAASWRERRDSWRLVPLDDAAPAVLVDRKGERIHNRASESPKDFDRERPCHLIKDAEGKTWLVDPCPAYRPSLILFGAGHVGRAIVGALSALPCDVLWVDEREDMFPDSIPDNVTIEITDIPEAVVDHAPPGASYLVMTHSHALDQRLSEAILKRKDVGWFGLIGSKTKRMQFEHRLRERGITQERLADMVCPIGVPGITGKAPAVIAIAVCAQLLQVWEAQEHARKMPALQRSAA